MKLLLYCTKAKPYLYKTEKPMIEKKFEDYHTQLNEAVLTENLNGKIVAECDFEVEELTNCGTSFMIMKYDDLQESYRYTNKVARGSCLDYTDLKRYLGTKNGYAIHIKNLHIFDEPKELSDYFTKQCQFGKCSTCRYGKNNIICSTIDIPITKAPQNMMYVYDNGVKKILISIQPQWMCLILNRIKDVEVRRVVLKEMLK